MCLNAEFCETELCLGLGYQLCMHCGPWFAFGPGWGVLHFRDASEPCIVCSDQSRRQMQMPQCSHWMCIPCARDNLEWDESRYHINPVIYGCAPCLHAPTCVSRPCDEDDDAVVAAWELMYPVQYTQWNTDEDNAIKAGETDSQFSSRVCPLCFIKYDRK
jgi:hypothetical protein